MERLIVFTVNRPNVQLLQLVVEENNSLKDILKGAVIVTDDGNLGDVSG